MKQILMICAVVALVGCGSDPNEKANELYVEAMQLISSAEEQTGEPAIKDYEQALAHLQKIIADYSKSDLAVKLISSEDMEDLAQTLARLRFELLPPVEKAIRTNLKKTEGVLTEADLAKVTRLNLYRTKITDAGLKEVAKLQNLETLELACPKITDAGLKEVAKLQKLEELGLWNTKITDAGLKELAKMKQLRELSLFGCLKITQAGVAELQKALPRCKIEHTATK